jgi:Glycosyltransferase family 87
VSRGRLPGAFVLCFVALLGLAGFFLLRPAFGGGPYYSPRPAGTTYAYWFLVAAAFVPYGLALRACRRGVTPSVPVLLGGAAILYLVLIPSPALQSQDVYQYLLYGKTAAGGGNPYVTVPVADPWNAFALWDGVPSVYGPVWTLVTAGVVRVTGGSVTAAFLVLKVITGAMAVVTTLALVPAVRGGRGPRGGAPFAVLAFAYNPMVLSAVGLGAHADVAVAAGVVGAVVAGRRDRDGVATLLLVGATLVKAYAGLILVVWLVALVWRRGVLPAMGHAVAALAAAVAAYAPFWEGSMTFAGLQEVGRMASASLTGTIQRLVAGAPDDPSAGAGDVAAVVIRVAAAAVLVAALLVAIRAERRGGDVWRAAAIVMLAYVLVTPWFLYWHLIGPLALVLAAADEALSLGTLTFSATSLVVAGGSSFLSGGAAGLGLAFQTAVRYGPPVAVAWRVRTRPGEDVPGRP